jgi:hypothetical protein
MFSIVSKDTCEKEKEKRSDPIAYKVKSAQKYPTLQHGPINLFLSESGDQQPDVLSDSSSSNTDSSTEAVLTADEVLIKMSPEFMAIVIQFDISHTAAAAMWNFVVNNG